MEICQVLLTRFNLATGGRERDKRESGDWLRGRFDLFEQFCLPTIAAQNVSDFHWLIFFDLHTPGWARDRIARAQEIVPFAAIFTELFDSSGWGRCVRERIGPPRPGRCVVTSNLDNDDGVARDYLARIARVVRTAPAEPPYAINFRNGLVLSDGRLYAHTHDSSAFTNLVEADTDSLRTVNTISHMELARHVRVVQEVGSPAWLQVVHGGNVSNRVRGLRTGSSSASGFPPEVIGDVLEAKLTDRIVENFAVYSLRSGRDFAAKMYRKAFPLRPQ